MANSKLKEYEVECAYCCEVFDTRSHDEDVWYDVDAIEMTNGCFTCTQERDLLV